MHKNAENVVSSTFFHSSNRNNSSKKADPKAFGNSVSCLPGSLLCKAIFRKL